MSVSNLVPVFRGCLPVERHAGAEHASRPVAQCALWFPPVDRRHGLGGQKLAVYLKKPALNKLFNRLTGTLFFGFGFMLLKAKH